MNNIIFPLTIEKQLERYVNEKGSTDRHEVLWHAWNQNKRWIAQLLEGTIASFPTYSRHDESHAQTVLHNIEMVLGEKRIQNLSASDCFVLLHSVYIHDIGMMISAAERKEIVSNEKFLKMVDFLEEEGDGSLREAVRVLKQKEYNYGNCDKEKEQKELYLDKLRVYDALIQLIGNYRRMEHGDVSKNILYDWTKQPDKLGAGFSLAGIPQRMFLTMAECARLHTDPKFETILQLPQEDNGYVFDYIHPRFISVLIQLGDILDIDNDRFHPLAMSSLENFPESSQLHYQKHLAIRKLHISPEVIEIVADCENQETLRLIRKECDMLSDILCQAGYYWSSICPSGFSGALPTLQPVDLRLNNRKIPKELVAAKFVISQKKAFEILEGANLYESRFVFLREFLQNAVDATKIEYWKECKNSHAFDPKSGHNMPNELDKIVSTDRFPIEITMESTVKNLNGKYMPWDEYTKMAAYSKSGCETGWKENEITYGVMVQIKDYGIGIGQKAIKQISNVGSSLDKKEICDMPDWLKPTAEFGIGLQSAFLIAPTFSCYTHTREGERYKILFGSGALSQYDGYINVQPVDKFEGKRESFGTCFEIFVPESKKLLHEQFPYSWDGEDFFESSYEAERPLRHCAELISQMTLYLDSLIGESLFPINIFIKKSKVEVPINTNKNNTVQSFCSIEIEGREALRHEGRSE